MLIITLVMLSVVTFMAVTFLAVSRRERVAVTVVEEQTRARLMAETAVARAQAEVVSRVIASSNLLNYGFFVSTNFISPYGFDAGLPLIVPNPTNVNYERTLSGGPMTADGTPWLRNIANLQYDPRPPVFFSVTNDPRVPLDFRFYLDLNRNGRFESNGLLPELGFNGQWLGTNGLSWRGGGELVLSNFFVGDPEWVGILQDPGLPHSPTNRFIGRMAYLVQPAGKSLDLNFIGNHALRINDTQLQLDGYYRNQGVGSWELNLAAFLRDLNTNVTTFYNYRGLAGPGTGAAAEDALSILRYRYGGDLRNLLPVGTLYGPQAANAFQADWIDGYSDGPAFTATNLLGLTIDDDLTPPNKPWSGSDNPRTYVDLQELFDTNKVLTTAGNAIWPARMLLAQNALSSYDRYTFYRLQSQMGTDSGAGELGKVNLNYNNTPPLSATNFVTWTPQAFFEAAANRLFVAARRTNIVRAGNNLYTNFYIGNALVRPGMSVTNILVHPYNEYTPEVHRLLQLAVNLYDATTNRADTAYPHLPTVLRPLFATEGDAIFIKGYEPVTNNARAILQSERILSLAIPAHCTQLASLERAIVYDVPFLIGAKKGLPNFNEFSLRNVAQVTRKLEVRKRTPADPQPFQTNLMYLLTLTNQFGLELWNSYTNPFPRAVRVQILGSYSLALIDGARTNVPLAYTNLPFTTPTWSSTPTSGRRTSSSSPSSGRSAWPIPWLTSPSRPPTSSRPASTLLSSPTRDSISLIGACVAPTASSAPSSMRAPATSSTLSASACSGPTSTSPANSPVARPSPRSAPPPSPAMSGTPTGSAAAPRSPRPWSASKTRCRSPSATCPSATPSGAATARAPSRVRTRPRASTASVCSTGSPRSFTPASASARPSWPN
ncbi:MAG: hypothetical protein M5U12_26150 [Verrucomicrobia bacterium]|nr:hypothetical protein [Verrucomicrobiota bacterium]